MNKIYYPPTISHNVIQSIYSNFQGIKYGTSEIKTDVGAGQIPLPIKHIIFLKWSQLPSI